MRAFLLLLVAIAAVDVYGAPPTDSKIIGGQLTTIEDYPYAVVMLRSSYLVVYTLACGGSIVTSRFILTAAHCFFTFNQPINWRMRIGSSFQNYDGILHDTHSILLHPNLDRRTLDFDIALLRTANQMVYSNAVQPVSIAGAAYNIPDNTEVYAAGWGLTTVSGISSVQLRHVQIWTVNQDICRNRYATQGYTVTQNMLCSGWLDVGGRDQCQGDSGGPLVHKTPGNPDVIIGVCSWGLSCAQARFPGVNARVSSASQWIANNAF